jgi:hypothetical protein
LKVAMARILGSQSCGDAVSDTQEEYGLFRPHFLKGIVRDRRPSRTRSNGPRNIEL